MISKAQCARNHPNKCSQNEGFSLFRLLIFKLIVAQMGAYKVISQNSELRETTAPVSRSEATLSNVLSEYRVALFPCWQLASHAQ